jgi:CubicO group peptidase (beta-lactamase class C family)
MNPTAYRLGAAWLAVMAGATFSPAQEPAPLPAQAEIVRRVTALVDSLAAREEFSGVVVLAHGGAPVLQLARGLAEREGRRPNTIETAFNIGSINKAFTQIAIRQLEAQGRLALDSTLGRYWPDYPNAAVRGVTIRQLLEMRSGIGGNVFGVPASGTRHTLRRLADFLPLFVNEPLAFPPGTRQAYSNAGYVVLGLLIERLSGEDYYGYVARHIYEPAGMRRTGHYTVDSLPANTASGYTRRQGELAASGPPRANTDLLPGRGSSAGGGYSTAADLLAFVAALREGRIPQGPRAGLGVAGGAPGVNAVLDGDLRGGYDLVVLANQDPPAAERVARAIRALLGSRD